MAESCALSKLLGTKLQNKTGEVDTESITSNEVIGLYFSAHWCPPCRMFTPNLAKTYDQMKGEGKKIEIVFVSSDKTQEAFDEYYGEMPWMALPYAERKLKAKLSTKFGVQGIPTLVLLDSKANLLTKDGRSAIASPEDYPWPAKTFSEMLGTKFLSKTGEVGPEAVEGKYLGLYFSASWCPPCRAFTPTLCQMYDTMKEKRNDFEFIFISGDNDEGAFKEYYQKMPFLALPFSEKQNNNLLNSHFEVQGIPTLVIVSPDGKTITTDARSRVSTDPEGLEFPFHPKPVNNVDNPAGINDSPSLVILAEGESKPNQEKFEKVLAALGEEELKKEDSECLFFIGTEEGGVAKQLRSMTKAGPATTEGGEEKKEVVCEGDECKIVKSGGKQANTKVVLFDIPDQGGFYMWEGAATEEGLKEFLGAYKAGSLTRQQLSK
jgi:nucleoredoxin